MTHNRQRSAINKLYNSPFKNEHALCIERNMFTYSLGIRKLFGAITYLSPSETFQITKPIQIHTLGFDRVIFSNPYVSAHSINLYEKCRKEGFPYLVIERGALPGTIFLDDTGFLIDSHLYHPERWNYSLTRQEQAWLHSYTKEYFAANTSLEKQPKSRISKALAKELKEIDKPILFVPLQMPDDTVTRYFCDENHTYNKFINFINIAIEHIGDQHHIMYKAHPLASDLSIKGAICANDLHINDAISVSDAVLTYNSGTGILTCLHEKPLGVFGPAFYAHDGICVSVTNLDQLEDFLSQPQSSYDDIIRERFLFHLIARVYSDVRFLSLPFQSNQTKMVAFRILCPRIAPHYVHPPLTHPDTDLSLIADALELGFAARRALLNRISSATSKVLI